MSDWRIAYWIESDHSTKYSLIHLLAGDQLGFDLIKGLYLGDEHKFGQLSDMSKSNW